MDTKCSAFTVYSIPVPVHCRVYLEYTITAPYLLLQGASHLHLDFLKEFVAFRMVLMLREQNNVEHLNQGISH